MNGYQHRPLHIAADGPCHLAALGHSLCKGVRGQALGTVAPGVAGVNAKDEWASDTPVAFELQSAEIKDGGSVWLRYLVKR